MNEPAPTKKGCPIAILIIAAAVLAVLALLAVPVAFLLYSTKNTEMRDMELQVAEAHHMAATTGTGNHDEHEIHFREGSRTGGTLQEGEELTRERFVGIMIDSDATSLSRETFEKQANGRKVRWLLQVTDIEAADGRGIFSGSFQLPYKIHSEHGYSGSSVQLQALFPASEAEALGRLRRDDWATIEGKLEITGSNSATLKEARVAGP